jgi:hypothetical protein
MVLLVRVRVLFRAQLKVLPRVERSRLLLEWRLCSGAVYTTEMSSLDDVALEWVGSFGMREGKIAGTRNKFEAWLIECDDIPRNVEFKGGAHETAGRLGVDVRGQRG